MLYYFIVDDGSQNGADICGKRYKNLIDICFSYSKYFTLLFKKPYNKFSDMEPYKIEVQKPDDILGFISSEYFERRFYSCDEETKEYMLNITDNFFDLVNWVGDNMPEDPIFYREDGTAFFWSMTHEGICVLSNRSNEEVMSVVSYHNWKEWDPKKYHCMIPDYFLEKS